MVGRLRHLRRRLITWPYQRLTRGWDDRTLWSLDHYFTKQLGEQLVAMANIAIGYPPSYQGGHSAWKVDLHNAGTLLRRYASFEDRDTSTNEEWDEVLRQAQIALEFVSKHLPQLWD